MLAGDRDSVLTSLREWLYKTNPAAIGARLDPDTDIIEARILESLQIVEFILFLERETGRDILAENLDPGMLRTLNSIYANFFASQA
jgi:acyl carrier protein